MIVCKYDDSMYKKYYFDFFKVSECSNAFFSNEVLLFDFIVPLIIDILYVPFIRFNFYFISFSNLIIIGFVQQSL